MSLNTRSNYPENTAHPNASQKNGIGRMTTIVSAMFIAAIAIRECLIYAPQKHGQFEPDAAAIETEIPQSPDFKGFKIEEFETCNILDVLHEFNTTNDEYKKIHIFNLLVLRRYHEDKDVQEMIIKAIQEAFLSVKSSKALQLNAALYLAQNGIETPMLAEYFFFAANIDKYKNPDTTLVYWGSVCTTRVFESMKARCNDDDHTPNSTPIRLRTNFGHQNKLRHLAYYSLTQYANAVPDPEEAAKASALLEKCKPRDLQPTANNDYMAFFYKFKAECMKLLPIK